MSAPRLDATADVLVGSVFWSTIIDLAMTHRIGDVVITGCEQETLAAAVPTRREIVVSPRMAEQDPELQRWFAAHELAHLVDERRSSWWELWPCGAGIVALAGLGAFSFVGPSTWGLTLAWFGLVLGGLFFLAGVALRCACQRLRERACDVQAAAWGMPFTPAIAKQISAEERIHAGRLPLPLLFRNHELPQDRITPGLAG